LLYKKNNNIKIITIDKITTSIYNSFFKSTEKKVSVVILSN
jgi:hypothetical protein